MNTEINSSMQSSRSVDGQQQQLPQPQHGTPESEFSNFDCYQNYTAPEVFVQHIAGIVNQGDVEIIVRAQKQMLQRFEKTNEMLLNCNALSNGRLKAANEDFKRHIKLINEMKKDLDYIFKKIRNIKTRIGTQYPQSMKKAEQKTKANSLAEDDKEGENVTVADDIEECTGTTVTTMKQPKDAGKSGSSSKHADRKLSEDNVTVNYVQMDAGTDNGRCISSNSKTDNESVAAGSEAKALDESTDNESSDCTTDT